MFSRSILKELEVWSKSDLHKPILLRGARQVGKTSIIELFGQQFDTFIQLNLERPQDIQHFQRSLSLQDIWQSILLSKNTSLHGKTLLFIDEIQHSPEAIALLRYFYEDMPELYVIAAGSLLEVVLEKYQLSFPVGRIEYKQLYPMTFQEYLNAMRETQVLEVMKKIPLPSYAHNILLQHFHRYTLLGGMPEVIANYRNNQDIVSLNPMYQNLLRSYLEDVSKYARNRTLSQVLRHCIESLPFEMGTRIKFQGFGNSNYRSREVGEALRTLERAMLIYLIYPTSSTLPPIRPNLKKSPRLQFLDTGLLNYVVGLQQYYLEFNDLHAFYKGKIAEHIVGQELLALQDNPISRPCFWARDKNQSSAEVDFIIQHQTDLIPIEVKAGTSGTLRSLHQFMNQAPHPYAIRLYAGPLQLGEAHTPQGKGFQLLNLPYFLSGQLFQYMDWMKEQ